LIEYRILSAFVVSLTTRDLPLCVIYQVAGGISQSCDELGKVLDAAEISFRPVERDFPLF